MATAPATNGNGTLPTSNDYASYLQHQVNEDHDNQTHHSHQQQASNYPYLALRFPTKPFDSTCYDTKSNTQHQPRWRLAQIVQNAYKDIVRTWMRLHHTFAMPSCHCAHSHQQRYPQSQYQTFTYSDDTDNSIYCIECSGTSGNAYSIEIGDMILNPRINLLLMCVPLGAAAYWLSAPAIVVFAINALAIVPLSSLLTDTTERIALEAGDAVGAFLNISLGNIVELILFLVTLLNGHVRIVQASILGSILVNLLPILGSALMAAHMTEGDCSLENTEIQMLACLLFVSVFVFMIPTSFNFTFSGANHIKDMTLNTSRASAILILVIYIAYFVHALQTNSQSQDVPDEEEATEQPAPVTPPPLLRRETPPLTPGPRTIRFADEHQDSDTKYSTKPSSKLYTRRLFEIGPESIADSIDWQDEEPRGRSLNGPNGPHSTYTVYQPLLPQSMRRYKSRSISAGSNCSRMSRLSRASSAMSGRRSFARAGLANVLSNDRHAAERNSELQEVDDSGKVGAILAFATVLIVASVLLAVSARLLVSTLDAVSHQSGLSEAVIGLVILPLAGNMSNYLTVASVAARDNLDLAVAVSVGSAIQIALCVAPLTVLAGWALKQPVTLALDVFELALLLGAVSLVNMLVLSEGRSIVKRQAPGLKGGILCACFLVMGIATFFAPNDQ